MIVNKGVLGKVVAHVYTIEFQKRSLPHIHLLVWFAPEDQIRTAEDLDQLISVEFPDQATHLRLYELVKKYMVYGSCEEGYPQAPCMVKGKCSKGFPKPYRTSTTFPFRWLPSLPSQE